MYFFSIGEEIWRKEEKTDVSMISTSLMIGGNIIENKNKIIKSIRHSVNPNMPVVQHFKR